MYDPTERSAIIANIAAKQSIDYRVIIEIACVSSPKELLTIREAYHARYMHSLEEDVASIQLETSARFTLNGHNICLVY